MNERAHPLWRSSGKPLSRLTTEELAEAIRYVDEHAEDDTALARALRELHDQRVRSGDGPRQEPELVCADERPPGPGC